MASQEADPTSVVEERSRQAKRLETSYAEKQTRPPDDGGFDAPGASDPPLFKARAKVSEKIENSLVRKAF